MTALDSGSRQIGHSAVRSAVKWVFEEDGSIEGIRIADGIILQVLCKELLIFGFVVQFYR
jgi:hypothetical protein